MKSKTHTLIATPMLNQLYERNDAQKQELTSVKKERDELAALLADIVQAHSRYTRNEIDNLSELDSVIKNISQRGIGERD